MYKRNIESLLTKTIKEGDSVLLLGPRQTGKTTLIQTLYPTVLHYNFANPQEKIRFAKNPGLLIDEVRGNLAPNELFTIDEVQKVPLAFDSLQVLLDQPKMKWRALLTGSSARKLKRGAVNTLPGRIIQLSLGSLSAEELGFYHEKNSSQRNRLLLSMLTRGNLPRIQSLQGARAARHLRSYVQTYLEQEIFGDALTKDIGQFARFLNVMAARSGNILNYAALSQEAGASFNTIKHHVGVLCDTLTAHLIPGFSLNDTKTWLSTPRLLFFDLGVRNASAERQLDEKSLIPEYGTLFEQWVGLEILAWMRNREPPSQLYYWRTTQHREIDWIIRHGSSFIAIEVKWSESWGPSDFSHLEAFKEVMKQKGHKVITALVCRTSRTAKHKHHHIVPHYLFLDFLNDNLG